MIHVAPLFALLSMEPVARAVGLPQPLMVSLLAAEPEPPSEPPKPPSPKQRAQPVQPLQPPPPGCSGAARPAA